jgi:rod shape-determining protein MreD
MNVLQTILVLLAAFLAVFWEAAFPGTSHWLKAQIDLLPALMVYASLSCGRGMIILTAICGGLFFDSLSANPFGITIFPLMVVGFAVYVRRDLILRDQPYAQFVLGASASALSPLITVLLLLTVGQAPLISWGSIWQWIVMSLGGGIATPIFFFLFDWCERTLGYRRVVESSFRPDREIRRGRN